MNKFRKKRGEQVEHFLQMKDITKSFGDNTVLSRIRFSADRGEVHALIGENGAGKTTLMKILAGLFMPDEGDIIIGGEKVTIQSPRQAQDLGIAMIYQEIRLFQDLNITENVYIGREPLKKWSRFIHWDQAYAETRRYLDMFGLNIDSKASVKSLSVGQQKFVEIIKALSRQAKIMIMDEPTAALTEREIELLFGVIRHLKQLGVTIVYISHRLEEIKQIADRVTVIRDGEVIQTCPVGEVEINEIVKAMAGKDLRDRYPKLNVKKGKEIMRVENLYFQGRIRNINFDIRQGEIIGLTGLSGAGRRTLAKVLFGINGPYEGSITIRGKSFRSMTPHIAKTNGLCYVTGINTEEGLIADAPISENITLTNLGRVSRAGFLNDAKETGFAKEFIERLEIAADENELVGNLSGGKQKKIVFAKWLFAGAHVLIIDEPTAGIDIGSKSDIYNIMNEMVLSGASIIIISSDLPEIMGMSDRIFVMYNGEIRKIFEREEATQEQILYYASGAV
ncbi:sugar ABC transporter ATP-binding protein [Paenibacillus hamazuiensis]|uniref:sugar ABC transporter ATP-binding protein n=1 Tax=Paenibacillus hamazuiensis TaxID=2936508 RepID=UPI00200F341E|nr:sugar ABC transporter ATP-binding protein [Paenibacillus hamazuiensis]